MKRNIIILVLVALTAALIAFCAAHFITCHKHANQPADFLRNRAFLARELRLNNDQSLALDVLENDFGKRVNEGCSKNCEARQRLAAALTETAPNQAELDGIVKDMCRAYETSERAALEHIQAVRGILNEEQRKAFDTMIGRCLCGTGGKVCHTAMNPVL